MAGANHMADLHLQGARARNPSGLGGSDRAGPREASQWCAELTKLGVPAALQRLMRDTSSNVSRTAVRVLLHSLPSG